MPWVRLDDGFPEHPKLLKAGPLAMLMQVAALCYCNRHLTDGFIPEGKVPTLLNLDGLGDWREVLSALLREGIWERVDGGYQVHDYLDYQPSRAQVLAEREQKREAGRKGGQASAQARAQAGAQAPAKAPAQAESKPVPVPGSDPDIPLPVDSASHDGLEEDNSLARVISHAPAPPGAATQPPESDPASEPEAGPATPETPEAAKPKGRKKQGRHLRPEAWELARELVDDMRSDGIPVRSDDTLHFASMLNSVMRARDSPVGPDEVREAWQWAKRQPDLAQMRVYARGFRRCLQAYKAAKLREEQEYEARKWRL